MAFYPAKLRLFAINLRANPSEHRKMKEIELDALDRVILGALTQSAQRRHTQLGGGG